MHVLHTLRTTCTHSFILHTVFLQLCFEDSDQTAKLETEFIKQFRSDKRLKNRKPGGENAHCGASPHFLYVVFGTPGDFEDGRILARVR
jgi:hypothetical protein